MIRDHSNVDTQHHSELNIQQQPAIAEQVKKH